MEPSETVEEWIRQEAAKLDTFYTHMMSCRVAVELPNRRHRAGCRYHIRIDLMVPGGELVVKREPSLHSSLQRTHTNSVLKHLEIHVPHRELRQAIDDAFKAMGRRLQDYARRQRGDIKVHEPSPHARVSKLVPAEGYGFLETPGGREIYFHENSVLDGGFRSLTIGAAVKFDEEEGDKGPQASTVKLIRDRHTHAKEPTALVNLSSRTNRA
jgi:cold shock CspA family protein/ribosome-associated translation inhibitor RaiA